VGQLRIRYGHDRPADAIARVSYRDAWFWIDDRDIESKKTFALTMLLSTLTETGAREALPGTEGLEDVAMRIVPGPKGVSAPGRSTGPPCHRPTRSLRTSLDGPRSNQRGVGDPTEFPIGSGKLYFAAILDLCSRFVVGWAVSAVNDRHLTLKALDMALARRSPTVGLVHHSDQGSTYASEDYRARLAAHGLTSSMSRRGNCYDNAVMESFFSTVKSELADRFDTFGDAKMQW